MLPENVPNCEALRQQIAGNEEIVPLNNEKAEKDRSERQRKIDEEMIMKNAEIFADDMLQMLSGLEEYTELRTLYN